MVSLTEKIRFAFFFQAVIVANLGLAGKSFRQTEKDRACKVVEFPAADVYYGTPQRKEG